MLRVKFCSVGRGAVTHRVPNSGDFHAQGRPFRSGLPSRIISPSTASFNLQATGSTALPLPSGVRPLLNPYENWWRSCVLLLVSICCDRLVVNPLGAKFSTPISPRLVGISTRLLDGV